MADPTSPGEDVYEAAARASTEAAGLSVGFKSASLRAAVDAGFAAGVAAGRAQAAADIRAAAPHPRDAVTVWLYDHCAKIADGEPRG